MMTVEKDKVVSMRYVMKDGKGTVLENTMNASPVSYVHGTTGILPLLQQQLAGLKSGDKKTVYLEASTNLTSEDFIFDVIIDHVREALKEEILLGYPVQLSLADCEADCECYRVK